MRAGLSRRRLAAAMALLSATVSAPYVVRAQARPRLVVVGGGFGGASAARFASQRYPDMQVVLVERKRQFVTCPYSNLVLAGLWTLPQITYSYDGLQSSGITMVYDDVLAIDPLTRAVRLQTGTTLTYDRLILSPGISLRWGSIEGYDEAAANLMPHAWVSGNGEQILLLRRQLESMPDGGVFAISVPTSPFRCPPGPYERVSMVADYFKRSKPRSKILILDANESFSKQGLFQDAWAELYPGMIEWVSAKSDGRVVRVDARAMALETEFGTRYKVDVANIVPPQSAATLAIDSGLTDGSGWVPVDPVTFEARQGPAIHVIGDANIGSPMPKSGFIANSTSKQALASAWALINNRPPPTPAIYLNTCYSHISAEYGISIAGVFRPGPNGFVETPNSGGVSPRGPLAQQERQRRLEALYADSWYQSITSDAFGGA